LSNQEGTVNQSQHRHHPDLCPDLAFLSNAIDCISEAYEQVDLDKLIEPKKYQEAWHHPEKYQYKKWCEVVRKKFSDMETHKVWKKKKRVHMPRERRCVKHKLEYFKQDSWLVVIANYQVLTTLRIMPQ
jgi:hypothetical protein